MARLVPFPLPAETATLPQATPGLIAANRRRLDGLGSLRRWTSPVLAGLDVRVVAALRANASGALLDVGCGAMPYRTRVADLLSRYDGLDVERRGPDLVHLASATDMRCIETAAYDTLLCSEVLEHIAEPEAALMEMHRVLRPGGKLVLSVPFLARLHEEPHDYFRYTQHGLRSLLERVGLEIEEIEAYGSIGSFVGHQVSTVALGATWHLPVVRWASFALNALFVVLPARGFDRMLGRHIERFPAGYVVVARRPSGGTG